MFAVGRWTGDEVDGPALNKTRKKRVRKDDDRNKSADLAQPTPPEVSVDLAGENDEGTAELSGGKKKKKKKANKERRLPLDSLAASVAAVASDLAPKKKNKEEKRSLSSSHGETPLPSSEAPPKMAPGSSGSPAGGDSGNGDDDHNGGGSSSSLLIGGGLIPTAAEEEEDEEDRDLGPSVEDDSKAWGVDPRLLRALKKTGVESFFPIQRQVCCCLLPSYLVVL